MGLFFDTLTYVSLLLSLAFMALCLASGLFQLAALAEEYTSKTHTLLKFAVWSVLGIHVVYLLFESLPALYVLVGILSHLAYLLLLRSFPIFYLASLPFLGSCGLFLISNILWYTFFVSYDGLFYSPMEVFCFFFLCVWMVPFGFFVSLTVNENVLPGAPGAPPIASSSDPPTRGPHSRRRRSNRVNLFKWAASYIPLVNRLVRPAPTELPLSSLDPVTAPAAGTPTSPAEVYMQPQPGAATAPPRRSQVRNTDASMGAVPVQAD